MQIVIGRETDDGEVTATRNPGGMRVHAEQLTAANRWLLDRITAFGVACMARLLDAVRKALSLNVALVLALTPLSAAAAPKAELWERWTAHNPAATTTIDHSAWARFLKTYVAAHPDGVNRFAYGRVSDPDLEKLATYIADLEAVPISDYNRDEQLAYWINLYNALTVKLILDRYPVASILKISYFFSFGPWDKKLSMVEGEELSLNDIEHRILRPIWRDPRVHYAVNCASIGCPNLRDQPFTAGNHDELLTRAAFEYINHARGAEVKDDRLIVSSIYEWFKEDFGDSDESVIRHLRQYAKPPLANRLDKVMRIADDRYDWSLNEGS